VTVIISFSDANSDHLIVRGEEDGVSLMLQRDDQQQVFVPDIAVLPLIRALQEFEQEQQTRLQNAWGV
jgi:hypothetical protein